MKNQDRAIKLVCKAIDADRAYVTDLTQKLVRIPSVNPKFISDPEQTKESVVQDLVQAELEAIGMSIDRWDLTQGRPNVVGQFAGAEDRSLLLCGHVDVVQVGDLSLWTMDPFGGEIKDGKIYGRGAMDMKGGLAAAIAAIRAVRTAGIELQGRLAMHSVVDEEGGGSGAKDAIERGHLAKAAIVPEPTAGDILVCSGGVEWLRVTVPGQTGHSAMRYNEIWPQRDEPDRTRPAVNAVHIAGRFLDALERFESSRCRYRQHPLLPPGVNTINVGSIRGGMGRGPDGLPIYMSYPGITPDVAVMDFSYRFLPTQTRKEVRAEFEEFVHHFCQQDLWLQEHPIKVEWELYGLSFPPMDTSPDHPIVQTLFRRRAPSGGKISGLPQVADSSHYANAGVAAVVFGPTGTGAHAEDEWVSIASIEETTKDLAAAIIEWCGVKEG